MDGKGGIAQAIAKGIGRFHAEGIKIAVANIDSFLVVFFLQIAVEIAVLLGKGDILIVLCPSVGKLTGRGNNTAEHIGKGMSAFRAQLAQVQNCPDSGNLPGKGHIHGRTAIDDQQKFGIVLCAEANGGHFLVRQVQISFFCFPVSAFSCLTAQHIDTGIRITGRHIRLGDRPSMGRPEIIQHHLHETVLFQEIDPFFLLCFIGFLSGSVGLFKISNPFAGGNGKAPVFHTFQNGHGMPLVHFTGAGSAFDGAGCTSAIKRHFLGC